jgi:hypothetical protein
MQSGVFVSNGVSTAPSTVSLVSVSIPLILLVLVWVIVARSTFIQGDDMERPNRVAQLYGYAVCLIAVVVFLASANSFVENLFTAANPLRGGADRFGIQPSVTSFEAYRATVSRDPRMNGPAASGAQIGSLPDSTLRARYEVLRADRVDQARFDAERSLATSGLLLVLSLALFAVHWRWLRAVTVARPDTLPPIRDG